MKQTFLSLIFAFTCIIGNVSAADQAMIKELDERLTNLELYQSINQIQFELELNNYIGAFDIRDRNPNAVTSDFSGQDKDQRTRMNS